MFCCWRSAIAGAPDHYDLLFPPAGNPGGGSCCVVQALVLTDIVVGATIYALLLALALQLHKQTATLDPGSCFGRCGQHGHASVRRD